MLLRLSALLGLSGVLAGALGAHAFKPMLVENGRWESWNTAVLYHLLHAATLLTLILHAKNAGLFLWTARLWVIGTLLFSFSIYLLSLGGPRWFGPVTPLGGLCLMAGWLCLLFHKQTD